MDSKQLIYDIFEMIDSRNFDQVRDLIHDDYVGHGGPTGDVKGPDGFVELARVFEQGFSDGRNVVDMVVTEGDMAAWRVTYTAVHTGEFMGIPATGKTVTFQGYNFGRVQDGKAVEHWVLLDGAALMAQLAPQS